MADKKSNDSRRKLLKSIAAGGGAVVAGKSLPESWSNPVIDSVMLPVHASTTDDSGNLPADGTTTAAPPAISCGEPGYPVTLINTSANVIFTNGIDTIPLQIWDGTTSLYLYNNLHFKHVNVDSILCTQATRDQNVRWSVAKQVHIPIKQDNEHPEYFSIAVSDL